MNLWRRNRHMGPIPSPNVLDLCVSSLRRYVRASASPHLLTLTMSCDAVEAPLVMRDTPELGVCEHSLNRRHSFSKCLYLNCLKRPVRIVYSLAELVSCADGTWAQTSSPKLRFDCWRCFCVQVLKSSDISSIQEAKEEEGRRWHPRAQ